MATLKIKRGTTYTLGYQHKHDGVNHSLIGATVRFTVKQAEYDDSANDATALIKKDILTGNADGYAVIPLTPEDTATLTPGALHYDIKVQEAPGKIYLMDEGKVTLKGSPTNRLT